MQGQTVSRSLPVYIGDEVSAAGFRLAGLRTLSPPDDGVLQTLEQAAREAPLVLVSAQVAAQFADTQLERLLARHAQQVVVVPDVYNEHPLPDLVAHVRRQLGVLE